MFLTTIQQETHTRIGLLRATLRLIQTPGFDEFYSQYSDQDYLQRLIEEGNKNELSKLFKEYVHGPLYNQSLRTLRIQARNKGIENWYWLTRPTLVRILS
jgi:hypothetical protein